MTAESGATVAAALDEATRRLRDAGIPDPRRDAMALVAMALQTDRGGVIARSPDRLSKTVAGHLAELVTQRASRKPLQYIEGRAEFFGLELALTADVLIPRPETESLVEAVLGAGLPDDARVADLGTGSGCIAVAIAVGRPGWRVLAIDRSAPALAVAARNAARHGLADRIAPVARDFATVPDADRGAYDAVVSNPPYVTDEEWRGLEPEVRDHEPRIALVPGPTGNEAYAVVVRAAHEMLRPSGLLALELGWKSEQAVRNLATEAGFQEIATRPDLQGIARVLTARRRSPPRPLT